MNTAALIISEEGLNKARKALLDELAARMILHKLTTTPPGQPIIINGKEMPANERAQVLEDLNRLFPPDDD